MSTVVGVDLSLTSTGLATISAGKIVDLRTVKSKGKKGDSLETLNQRLCDIGNEVSDYVDRACPDLVVIEAPSYASRFGSPHERAGLWWDVVSTALAQGFYVARVAPQGRAKYGTGKGNAKKDVVEAFVREVYGDLCPRRIANDDECDAIILAAMGSRHLGFVVEQRQLDEANLASMASVLWPTT